MKNLFITKNYLIEGVLVAKKDTEIKHHDLDVPNLHVIQLAFSLRSRGYVKEQFNWGWYYWFLTNEGIEYLRKFLHVPEEVVPATLKKGRPSRPSIPRADQGEFGAKGQSEGVPQGEKKVAPGADFRPSFNRGGFGRGNRGGRGGGDSYRRDTGAPRGGRGGAKQGQQ